MAVSARPVGVAALFDDHRHELDMAVADAALRDDVLGEFPHHAERAAQDRHFEAVLVVEVHMQSSPLAGRDGRGAHRSVVSPARACDD